MKLAELNGTNIKEAVQRLQGTYNNKDIEAAYHKRDLQILGLLSGITLILGATYI